MSLLQQMFTSHAAHDAGTAALDVRGLRVCYNSRCALDDLSFQLGAGDRVAVIGPNGAGKTTLFKAIAGLLPPAQGAIRIFGHEPLRHLCIAYVVQRSQVDWSFPVTVADVVMMGRIGELGLLRRARAADRDLVRHCLEMVGIADLAERQIGELSGGQQQRMFIARAIAQEAQLMLMDEPLTGLDVRSQEDILSIFDELSRRRVTIMVATHDLNLAAEHFDRVMLLNKRLIGIGKPAELFTPERLLAAYGAHARPFPTSQGMLIVGDACCGGGKSDGPTV